MYQIDEHVQIAIERIESFDLPPEKFSQALSEEVRLLVGRELSFQEANLAIQSHAALDY